MKSLTTPDFWNLYAKLPLKIRKQARKTYQLWQENHSHPSLHFKKVGKNLWSARITQNYRALALKKGDDYYWVWIGTHDEYELLLS
ncbi:hypothetical protein C7B62_10565 [Pleurocapsa sp. CCALA 161]|uniref:ParE family toxin-like protein n=1 Tax=Pleurocapsa sp. CCALA 161 TaxID=2107688 RepID=UPI000D05FA02|nr:hypothetical protein [Pleurocapsa sp. CCALA 161]PSB10152.1 hypothetical protein C7B62_10565 [Pleurocapsa sp. CCALA 161]